jgi:hypothetical protein
MVTRYLSVARFASCRSYIKLDKHMVRKTELTSAFPLTIRASLGCIWHFQQRGNGNPLMLRKKMHHTIAAGYQDPHFLSWIGFRRTTWNTKGKVLGVGPT